MKNKMQTGSQDKQDRTDSMNDFGRADHTLIAKDCSREERRDFSK
jgi:hypothetical protein